MSFKKCLDILSKVPENERRLARHTFYGSETGGRCAVGFIFDINTSWHAQRLSDWIFYRTEYKPYPEMTENLETSRQELQRLIDYNDGVDVEGDNGRQWEESRFQKVLAWLKEEVKHEL